MTKWERDAILALERKECQQSNGESAKDSGRSKSFPWKTKAKPSVSGFAFERTSSGESELSSRLTEARDTELARTMISERKKKILAAVVDEYVRTAEPVGSKSIAAKAGLGCSSATIRNELAELVSLGYLEQPHTSAGRVPTPMGYRMYVNELMEKQRLSLEETEDINRRTGAGRHHQQCQPPGLSAHRLSGPGTHNAHGGHHQALRYYICRCQHLHHCRHAQ